MKLQSQHKKLHTLEILIKLNTLLLENNILFFSTNKTSFSFLILKYFSKEDLVILDRPIGFFFLHQFHLLSHQNLPLGNIKIHI